MTEHHLGDPTIMKPKHCCNWLSILMTNARSILFVLGVSFSSSEISSTLHGQLNWHVPGHHRGDIYLNYLVYMGRRYIYILFSIYSKLICITFPNLTSTELDPSESLATEAGGWVPSRGAESARHGVGNTLAFGVTPASPSSATFTSGPVTGATGPATAAWPLGGLGIWGCSGPGKGISKESRSGNIGSPRTSSDWDCSWCSSWSPFPGSDPSYNWVSLASEPRADNGTHAWQAVGTNVEVYSQTPYFIFHLDQDKSLALCISWYISI